MQYFCACIRVRLNLLGFVKLVLKLAKISDNGAVIPWYLFYVPLNRLFGTKKIELSDSKSQ